MFEQAGDDPALGIARSWALRRILGRVNKRLEIRGQDPAPLGVFRRPVDNAFVPGMMAAVRQVEALRDHAVKLGHEPPGDWKDLPRAFARVAYVMRSEEHTSELQSLMRISYAVFFLTKKKFLFIF